MESPHFHSQHSEVLLNVSAFHSSSPFTPRAKSGEAPVVAESLVTQTAQGESHVPESVERVEDSYQDSLPKELPPPPTKVDEEEDLSGVSPKARASLDARMASWMRAPREQPTAPSKRNAIDAFLEAGATVPSSGRGLVKTSKETAAIEPADDDVTLDPATEADDANVSATVPESRDKGANRKPQETSIEINVSEREDDGDQNNQGGLVVSRRVSKRVEESADAARDGSSVSMSRNRSSHTDAAVAIGVSKRGANNDCTSANKDQTHAEKHEHVTETKLATDAGLAEPAKATRDKIDKRTESSTKTSKDRPRRQAKQSALEKLEAKHGKVDGETVSSSDEELGDDGSEFDLPDENGKPEVGRGRDGKQLPTPVTNGNAPKEAEGPKPQGKLKTAKSVVATDTKRIQNEPVTRDVPARSGTSADGKVAAKRHDKNRSATPAISTKSLASHQRTQQQSEQKSPPQRHGALKRPARALSRGRRPQIEDRYAFPENTPGRKRKGRSGSRTSRASTVKPGPARQRMQSESVKERLDRANADLRESSVPQQSRRKKDKAAMETRKPAVPTRTKKNSQPPSTHERHDQRRKLPTASYQKPGSSQANAITIEQGPSSSSSGSPSPDRGRAIRSKAIAQVSTQRNKAIRPRTPAPVRSSPPGTGTGLTHTQVKDKPSIIAFGRHGPRNQGTSSAVNEPRSAVSAKLVPDCDVEKKGTQRERGRTNRPTSQHSSRLSQSGFLSHKQTKTMAEPNNVSASNDDIFGESTKNRKNKTVATMLEPSQSGIGSGQEDQNDAFAMIDDFDDTTLVNDDEQLMDATKQPSTSQLAMPPPKPVSKGGKSLKSVEASTREAKKAAKIVTAKDTPRPYAEQKVGISSARNEPVPRSVRPPAIEVNFSDHSPPPYSAEPANETLEACSPGAQSALPVSQGRRKRGQTAPQVGSPSKKRKSSPESCVQQVAKAPQPAHEANLPSRISKVYQTSFLEVAEKGPALEADKEPNLQSHDPVKRSDRRKNRAGRRTTQGSQGVDILGSPYPKELEVPTKTTALEVYSQQANLSSDQVHEFRTVLERSLDLRAVPRMNPTTRFGLVSSNGKPIPAAPQESSKAVTRVASAPLAEQLLKAKSTDTSEDPFNTSSLVRKLTGPNVNKYKEALRQHGIILKDQSSDERHDEEEGGFDDVDSTLERVFKNARKTARDVTISPVASEQSDASTADAPTRALEDVGDWRNTLKPRQTYLFDSLVIAAHKLVRHMVDQETANRNIVADYRRRGEIIVSEFQRKHVEEYQQYTQSLEGLKKQAADKLAAQGRKLKQSMKDADKARAERKKGLLARNEADDMLKKLVAGLEA